MRNSPYFYDNRKSKPYDLSAYERGYNYLSNSLGFMLLGGLAGIFGLVLAGIYGLAVGNILLAKSAVGCLLLWAPLCFAICSHKRDKEPFFKVTYVWLYLNIVWTLCIYVMAVIQ